MKLLTMSTIALIFIFVAPFATAGSSEVNWINPSDYRDVNPGDGHRGRFRAKVFSDFEEHFAKLARTLPEDHTLIINVKNVDLAGDVNHSMRRIRVITELYIPRMTFEYEVLNAEKEVIRSDMVKLKDVNFMMNASIKRSSETLAYEKKMLDDWFDDTFNQH